MSYKRITIGEINDMPSMTVPGHAMTVKEMLDRAMRGLPIPVNKFTEYDEDPDFDDVDPLGQMGVDKFDIQDRAMALHRNLKTQKQSGVGDPATAPQAGGQPSPARAEGSPTEN